MHRSDYLTCCYAYIILPELIRERKWFEESKGLLKKALGDALYAPCVPARKEHKVATGGPYKYVRNQSRLFPLPVKQVIKPNIDFITY